MHPFKTKRNLAGSVREQFDHTIDDIHVMLSFARENGIALEAETRAAIDELFAIIDRIAPGDPIVGDADCSTGSGSLFDLALVTHGGLSAAITPATAASVRASSFRENKVLIIISIGGCICLLSLVLFGLDLICGPDSQLCNSQNSQSLIAVGAAGLGSAFYALYTARPYLRDGTFNPRYNQVYMLRFVLGILAGFILSHLDSILLNREMPLGSTTLAFIGGFSSEAVALILRRIAHTLVAAIQGSEKKKVKGVLQTQKAEALQAATEVLSQTLAEDPDQTASTKALEQKLRETLKKSLT